MKLIITEEPARLVLRWMQRVLFAASVAMLAYCAFVLTDTWVFQRRADHGFERLLREKHAAPVAPAVIEPDGLIGRIEVSRIGLSAIVFEGTGRKTLRQAVGQIAGTALPGAPGNVGLSAHRDTFFRPLRHIRESDIITFTTSRGEYRYRVVSTTVVKPHDVGVLATGERESLTLVTCYPFYFVGAAPDRFVVRAERFLAIPEPDTR
ncbi:MAG: class D sortase [Bryobacterales bacterium]|nr:class D sortase [Bryobacterales bacterium]